MCAPLCLSLVISLLGWISLKPLEGVGAFLSPSLPPRWPCSAVGVRCLGEEHDPGMDLVALLKSHFLCHLIFCYVFIVSGLIINTIQLCTLLLWPVNKQLFRKINCRLSYCVSSQLVMLLEWWSGTECVIYTDPRAYPKYGKENAIVVLNHKFEIDFLCGWSLAERFGVLGEQNQRFEYPPFSAVEASGRALSCSSVALFSLRGEKNHPNPSSIMNTDPPPSQERVWGVLAS
ncbi:PREDICTED: 1-acyl-sn-glycerol-3-phosphate acyltransferase delta-like [Bison bison bison]|uniref:1-acylglycerol-3-phosphate O-acyltransferase n=1 Tax=Bison bison bison TaxID=43346 RepID=A0A6P3GUH3_BISBB|nr:PREDICTED: 1-acyl-sn-glycerol-3-phosphate acyltransferase delta-like [Bison bison bison]